jgi:hypothetical protein
MITRPKMSHEGFDFECAGSPGSPGTTAWDHTVLQTPTASIDLDTKDNHSYRTTTQDIFLRPSLEGKTRELWDKFEQLVRQKSTDRQDPEDIYEEDNTFGAKEPACNSHLLPRKQELKVFPNVTTNCGPGLTKCKQVTSLQDLNAEADKYRSTES